MIYKTSVTQRPSLPGNCDIMEFDPFKQERKFKELWDSVRIERSVPYTLFTFGDSDLPYYLVTGDDKPGSLVKLARGEVKISRPKIITPYTAHPQFENFFENDLEEEFIQFLMTRSAAFSNLKLTNQVGSEEIVSDQVEEVVDRINQKLDKEEEDRVAILSAPAGLSNFAVLKYTTERVMESASGNLQELRERGLLPE
ncbi:hypothetical protein Pla110_10680 [Polystyrenella longa]|uniref:Uncharacterized protein n=1 Tax=Polystyrenella longa TaxID=2528007 RepID=A0A518CJG8_9PLAN|nr:hypothetical protein [Polystyrenella longa]QDU79360.1 hypothetical protein Pla110_10680 [Polystyrenella longa]